MTKRPSLKDQLSAQRTAGTAAQGSSVADTFRKSDGEVKTRTSLYLTKGLAKRLKLRAVEEGRSGNQIVIEALERYLDSADGNGVTAS